MSITQKQHFGEEQVFKAETDFIHKDLGKQTVQCK